MIPPKEKAEKLINRHYVAGIDTTIVGKFRHQAIQNALISVDEIINSDSFFPTLESTKEFTKYWYEVQEEIKQYNPDTSSTKGKQE
jgi:hypothetical protein